MHSMHKVLSADGTPIAYEIRGQGPPLVMVHGSSLDHTRWGSSIHRLAEHFTLVLMDRRGRGSSGDGPVYSIEREFEGRGRGGRVVGPSGELARAFLRGRVRPRSFAS